MAVLTERVDGDLWKRVKNTFSEASSYKVDYDNSSRVYHVTLFFLSGHTQMIYLPESAVTSMSTGMGADLEELLSLYKADQDIYKTLQIAFPEGNSYGFRVVGDTTEWIGRINYPDGTSQVVEGKGTEIVLTHARKSETNKHSSYVDLQKELINFIEDPQILRDRMAMRALYGAEESFDSLFEEREE